MGSCISFTSYYYYYICKQLNKRESTNTLKPTIKNNSSYNNEEKVNLLQSSANELNEIIIVREKTELPPPKLETQNSEVIPLEKKEYIKEINYHFEDDFELV